MIETHAHIYDEQFDHDRPEMIKRAIDRGITEIWMPNCASDTLERMLSCEAEFEIAKPMIGLHPCYVKEDFQRELDLVEAQLIARKYFMIGEIGLDFYWDTTFTAQQETVFLQQLQWAKDFNLPICIHSRQSFDRCCEIIEGFGWAGLKGIFHCFSGSLADAHRAIELGFLLGIGGVATFKNGGIAEWIGQIDVTNIVLETDSPYLAPVPYRGKRNEVAYVELVAQKLADLYQMPVKDLAKITTDNARKLL